ncbi:hemerythrin HHE cation binding domain-containing protein [Xylariaceae sp. FL0804]|nr:hemerythrin HHE cation binding domain-containing protein [Xylariaceae sp. FL0804]
MAPTYADHPFKLVRTPHSTLSAGEEPDEYVESATHMACAHNLFIRALNAIYLQAPHVPPAQLRGFLGFAEMFYTSVEHHHRTEEDYFFPLLVKMSGDKDIMRENHEQHEAFQAGLAEYVAYVRRCQADHAAYDAAELVRLIDGFGPVLQKHLEDEIPSFVALRKHDDKLKGFFKQLQALADKTAMEVGLFAGGVFVMANHDVEYEGGLHASFPPIPGAVAWGMRNMAWWVHSDWWAFAPCDGSGKMRPLDVPAA